MEKDPSSDEDTINDHPIGSDEDDADFYRSYPNEVQVQAARAKLDDDDDDDYDESEYIYSREGGDGGDKNGDDDEVGTEGDGDEEWVVETILRHKTEKGNTSYYVKWEGYDDPSWMSRDELLDISYTAVKQYESNVAKRRDALAKELRATKDAKTKQIAHRKKNPYSFYHIINQSLSLLPEVDPALKVNPPPERISTTNQGSGATLVAADKGGRVRSLKRLAIEALAVNLLLFENLQEVPIQYRSPIFIALVKKQQLTSEHLKILLGGDQKTIDVSFCSSWVSSDSVTEIGLRCGNLRSLNIANCADVNDEAINSVAKGCPNLTFLDMSGCNSVTNISLLGQGCRHLKVLRMASLPKLALDTMEGFSYKLRELEELDVNNCVTAAPDHVLQFAFDSSRLHTLKMKDLGLRIKRKVWTGDRDIKLKQQPARNVVAPLEYLDISGAPVFECGLLKYFATTLRTLIMNSYSLNRVIDIASVLEKYDVLETLEMRGCDTHTTFLLRTLLARPKLQHLDISGAALYTSVWDLLLDCKRRGTLKVLKAANITCYNGNNSILPFINMFRNQTHPFQDLDLSGFTASAMSYYRATNASPIACWHATEAEKARTVIPPTVDWSTLVLAPQPCLTKLNISDIGWLEHHHLTAVLQKCPNITDLIVVNNRLLGFHAMRPILDNLLHLESLEIGHYNVDNNSFATSHNKLKKLKLVRAPCIGRTGILEAYSRFPNLHTVIFERCSHVDYECIVESKYYNNIKEIRFMCPQNSPVIEYRTLMHAAKESRVPKFYISECQHVSGDTTIKTKPSDQAGCRVHVIPCSCSNYTGYTAIVANNQLTYVI